MLRLVASAPGGDGLPASPAKSGTAALARTGGTTVVALPPGAGTGTLTPGGRIRFRDGAGGAVEFGVRSRRTVDVSTASGVASAGGDRLVLVQQRDGEVLVVVAG